MTVSPNIAAGRTQSARSPYSCRETTSSGLVTDLIMGVIGSVLGGFLFGLLGLSADGAIGSLVTATIGAIVLIAGLRWINRARI